MPTPRKRYFLISFALILAIQSATFARPISQNKKASATKQKQMRSAAAKQKAEFWRWQNDPKITQIERSARKVLRWKIYGAANCGFINRWESEEDNAFSTDGSKVVKRAVDLHAKRKPFLFSVETISWVEGIVENPVSTESYRTIIGTRSGEVYEFWQYSASYTDSSTIHHRKWKKPTVRNIGRDILFFDAGQKQK